MKKKLKLISSIIMFLAVFKIFSNNVVLGTEFNFSEQITNGWTTNYYGNKLNSATTNVVGTIVNTIRLVGTGIAIIMIIYVAIKYMSAAPSEKADFKKSATAYVVGAVVLFASTNILGILAEFATSNTQ